MVPTVGLILSQGLPEGATTEENSCAELESSSLIPFHAGVNLINLLVQKEDSIYKIRWDFSHKSSFL